MRKITTRLISAALAASMMLSVCPVSAFAATGGQEPEYGVATQDGTDINPITSGSRYISSGGTYNLKGGNYTTSWSPIIINTTDAVTLNIDGDITATASSKAFIYVQKACTNLTINGNGYTINQTGGSNVLSSAVASKITITGGTLKNATNNAPAVNNIGGGTITITGGKISGHRALQNTDSYAYIKGGELECTGTYGAVWNGTVTVTGGTITAPNSYAVRAKDLTITGGTIQKSKYGISMSSITSSAKIDGNVIFENNTEDVHLASGKTFTLTDAYTSDHVITVGVDDTVSANSQRQITTSGISTAEMLKYVKAANSSYAVRYDASGNYLYLWRHTHTWNYTASGNTITAKCSSDSRCDYYTSGLTLTLTAPEVQTEGDGNSCEATVENGLGVTGAAVSAVRYTGVDNSYNSTTAPTTAGTYKATVTAGGKTAEVTYTIKAKTYEIIVEGGTADKTEAAKGETVTLTPGEPAPTGQEFDYWTVNGEKIDGNTFPMPDGKAEVKAVYKNKFYDLTVNGGEPEKKEYNSPVSKTAEEKTGEYFTGWEATGLPDGTDTSKPEISFRMPAGNVTLTANYKKRDYTVEAVNGTVAENKTTAQYEDEVTFTARDTEKGEKFTGWTFNVDNVEFVDGGANSTTVTVKMPANNLTATANFENELYTIKVSGGSAVDKAAYNTRVELTVDEDAFSDEQEFDHWTCDVEGVTFEKDGDAWYFNMPAEPVEITAVYKDKTYNITVKGGTADKTEAKKGDEITLTVGSDAPEGKVFDYWTVNGEPIEGDTFRMPGEPVTVEAVYKDAPIVTHKVNTVNATADKEEAVEGETVTVTANEKPGKEFTGWSIEGGVTEWDDKTTWGVVTFTMPDGDVTITANYKDITYNPGDPVNTKHIVTVTNGEKDAEELSYEKDAEVTLPAEDVAGKTFIGWTVEGLAEFNETPAKVLTFTMPDNDVTAVAHYRTTESGDPVNDAHIITTVDAVSDKDSAKAGETVTVTANEKPGKEFTGWSIEGGVTEWDDKTTWGVVTFTMPDGDVTITANYKDITFNPEKPVNNKHIVTVTNGEKDAEELSYEKDAEVTLPAEDVAGKTFIGWTVEGLAEFNETPSKILTFTMPDNDVTAVAHYRTAETGGPVNDAHIITTVDAVSDKDSAKAGETVTVMANEKPGKEFTGWSIEGGVTEWDDKTTWGVVTFTMPDSDVTVTANYKDITFDPEKPVNNKHIVTVTSGEKDAEELSYEKDAEVTLTAEDVAGKTFIGWTVEGLAEFNETPAKVLTFTMPDNDVTAVAHYRTTETGDPVNDAHIITTVDAVSDKDSAKAGETVTVTANEKPGKEFTGWSIEGGVTEWDDKTTWGVVTFTMPDGDVTITANYKDITFDPEKPVNNKHIVTVTNGEKDAEELPYEKDAEVTLTAEDVAGKTFIGWTVEGLAEFNETPAKVLTFTMPDNDVTAVAHYRTTETGDPVNNKHFLTVDGEEKGSYEEGEEITLTAKEPVENELFKGWKVIAPEELDVTTDGLNITFTMPAADVELKTVYDAKIITELDPDKYEGLEKNDDIGGVTVKEDYELELPETVVVQEPVENKGTIVSGKFEEPVTGGNIAGGTYLEVKDADAVTGGVFAQKPEVKQGGTRSPMDLLKVVDADDTLMKQCSINDIIVPQSAETYALYAENSIEDVEPVAFIIGEQTITVKYTGDNDKFSGWTSQDIDLSQATVSDNGKTLTFAIAAIGDQVVTIKAAYKADEAKRYTITAEGSVTVNGLGGTTAKAGDFITITLDKSIIPEGMAFNGWSLTPSSLMVDMDYMAEMISFIMPESDVTATALTCPAEIKDDTDYTPLSIATGVVGGAVITGILGWQAYNLAVDSYVQLFMPYLPSNRAELAFLLWHDADEPACPGEAYTDIDAEADSKDQISARWVVESGLLDEADEDDETVFEPTRWVSKFTAAKAWYKAQKLKMK